jgi:hypothetical protein
MQDIFNYFIRKIFCKNNFKTFGRVAKKFIKKRVALLQPLTKNQTMKAQR